MERKCPVVDDNQDDGFFCSPPKPGTYYLPHTYKRGHVQLSTNGFDGIYLLHYVNGAWHELPSSPYHVEQENPIVQLSLSTQDFNTPLYLPTNSRVSSPGLRGTYRSPLDSLLCNYVVRLMIRRGEYV